MKSTRSKLLLAGLCATFAVAGVAVAMGGRVHDRVAVVGPHVDAPAPLPAPPATLRATGLYVDGSTTATAPGVRPFAPQYPLWTDGAAKRRWIFLPRGAQIDATRADAWQFPVGTKLWKEFSFDGRAAETRYMERTAAGWIYASYAWDAAGGDATLVSDAGAASVAVAPGVRHSIPSKLDCTLCHGTNAPVLGFSALQLSTDRDPFAPHAEPPPAGALDLAGLVAAGQLRDFALTTAPRVDARTPTERAALGYLHGNCGSCHRPGGAADSVGMYLLQSLEPGAAQSMQATTLDVASRFRPAETDPAAIARRIAPGDPAQSTIVHRMGSRAPAAQMPPIGTHLVDREAVVLVSRWIRELPTTDRH